VSIAAQPVLTFFQLTALNSRWSAIMLGLLPWFTRQPRESRI